MKAMTKQQIAAFAGVSVRTLYNWCKPYKEELERLGMRPHMIVLPPKVVQFICDTFCIDVEEVRGKINSLQYDAKGCKGRKSGV